jgi:RNA polymerase sigma factor (sigma-70 family)
VWMESLAIEISPGEIGSAAAEDSDLVAQVQSGDAGAFEALISRHQKMVGRLAYRLLGSTWDLDDVVQDVFLAVLLKINKFRGDCAFSTWLTQITLNRCRTILRRQERKKRWLGWLRREKSNASENPSSDEAAEMSRMVRRAVYRLPERYRTPVVLRYFEYREIEQIAQILGLSRGAVEVRLSRAREKLKEMLAESF